MRVLTIGFTKTNARAFFETIRASGARRLVDVRLNNQSQLAGFAKREDLAYFLWSLGGIDYQHRLDLAPTEDLLSSYRGRRISWTEYESQFLTLMRKREIERCLPQALIDGSVLLCSEHRPEKCHRRLVAEYLQAHWPNLSIVHLDPSQRPGE